MPHVIIMDPKPSVGLLLKKALETEGYKVTISSALQGRDWSGRLPKADLVMINTISGQGSGWETYQRIKETDSKVALMVYAMDQWDLATAKWVIEAVDEALKSHQQFLINWPVAWRGNGRYRDRIPRAAKGSREP